MSACLSLPSGRLIPEDDFDTEYRPLTGPNGSALLDNWREVAAAAATHAPSATDSTAARHVWTVVDPGTDGTLYGLPGWHGINVVGYALTEEPWESRQDEAVWLSPERAGE